MSLVFYISGHGFGHASRSCQLIGAVARRAPGLRLVVRTTVPEWFIRAGLDVPVEIVSGETDTGVLQPDSLSIDDAGTAARAAEFYRTFDTRVATGNQANPVSTNQTLGSGGQRFSIQLDRAALLEAIRGITLAEGTLDFQYERK